MEDKIKELFGILNDSKDFKGVYATPEELSSTLSDETKISEFYDILNSSEEFKGIFASADEFKISFNLKKKSTSPLDLASTGQTVLQELGQPLNESITPKLPSAPEKPLAETGSYFGDLVERIGAGALDWATSGGKQARFAKKLIDIPKNIVKGELSLLGMSDETADKISNAIPFLKPKYIDAGVTLSKEVWEKIEKTDEFKGIETKAQALQQSSARYDKSIEEFIKNKEYNKAVGASFLSAAESLPLTLTAMFGGPVGLASIGAYSSSQQYDQLSKNDDMKEVAKISNAIINGGLEIATEKLGSANYGKMIKSLYKTVGKEQAEQVIKAGMKNWFSAMFKKIGVFTQPVGEALEEGVNQFGSNITARVTGEDPERPLGFNVVSSMAGGAAGGSMFIPVATAGQILQRTRPKEKKSIDPEVKAMDYSFKGKEITKQDAAEIIDTADELTDVNDLLIKDDKALESRIRDKFKTTDIGTVPTEIGALEVPQAVADAKQLEDLVNTENKRLDSIILRTKENGGDTKFYESDKEILATDPIGYWKMKIKSYDDLSQEYKEQGILSIAERFQERADNARLALKLSEKTAQKEVTTETPFKIGDQSFATKEELNTWLDENYTPQSLSRVDDANTEQAVGEWEKANKDVVMQKGLEAETKLAEDNQRKRVEGLENAEYKGIVDYGEGARDSYDVTTPSGVVINMLLPHMQSKEQVQQAVNDKRDTFKPKTEESSLLQETKPTTESTESIPLGEEKPLDSTGDTKESLANKLSDIKAVWENEGGVPLSEEVTKQISNELKLEKESEYKESVSDDKIKQQLKDFESNPNKNTIESGIDSFGYNIWFSISKGKKKGTYNITDNYPEGNGFYSSQKSVSDANESAVIKFVQDRMNTHANRGSFTMNPKMVAEKYFNDKENGRDSQLVKEIDALIKENSAKDQSNLSDKPLVTDSKVEEVQTIEDSQKILKESDRLWGERNKLYEPIADKMANGELDNKTFLEEVSKIDEQFAKDNPQFYQFKNGHIGVSGEVKKSAENLYKKGSDKLLGDLEKGFSDLLEGKAPKSSLQETKPTTERTESIPLESEKDNISSGNKNVYDDLVSKGFKESEEGGLDKNGVNIGWRESAILSTSQRGDVYINDSRDKKNIVLQEIKTLEKAKRGQGEASRVLDVFLKATDNIGATVYIEPTPIKKYGEGLSQADLIKWYEKRGFKKKTDFVWVREPVESSLEAKEPISAPITEKTTEAPPEPPKPVKTAENTSEGEQKPLGAQENALDQIETEQQQILSDIVNENKEFYNVLHGEQAVKNANKFIEEKGLDGVVEDLINKTTDINEYPTRQVARMVMIDHFTRILGNSQETKANKDRAYNLVNKLQQVLSKEANKTGQGNAHLNLWKVMQPAGLLEFTKRKIADFNDSKLKKKYKGGEKTVGQLIDLIYSNINEANKKIIDDILEGKTFESKIPEEKPNQPRKPAKVRTVPKEQVVAEKNYRKNLLDEYKAKKKKGGAGQLNSSMPLSIEQMELGGNLIASYVRQGYYQVADIIERLKKDFDSVGDKIDDTQVDEILSSKKEGKTTYRSWLTAQEAKIGIKDEMKSLKLRISDIVKMHWSERDALGRTLAQKLIDDAGLTDAEAKTLEKAILDEYDSMIKERLDSFKELSNILGKEKIPTEGKKKLSVMDKMLQMINLGALDEEIFRELFAEKFGLAPTLNRNQSNIIMQKASVVQQMTGKGWFYRDAVIDMAKYMYELVPRKAMNEIAETWTALAYTHMLSGIPTSILNIWSAGSNMVFKPFRDITNVSRWIKMAKGRKTGGISDFYMPFGAMYYTPLLEGMGHGATEAAEIYANGDITSKYVEEISTANQFKVGQLERNKYGNNRFKRLRVGKIDINPFNYEKYISRNLSAQDRLMFNTAFDMEVASILREALISPDLRGKALTKAVNDYIQGYRIDQEAILAKIEKETKEYEELSGKKVTDRQKKIRLRELIVSEFPISTEEKQEAEALSRSNIFTDERGGLIATTAYAIGRLSNAHPLTGVVFKPFVPFTHIVGNVVESMIDYTPFYGFLRANGLSISALKKLVDPLNSSAQMGERGTNAYYEQMGRAWFGTISFLTLAALLVGNDDDDDIQISGGYNQEGFKKPGRTNVMPKYSIRYKGVDISYLNIPSLAIPLGIIGNFNDALKSGMPEEELNARLAVSLLTAAPKENPLIQTMFMVKDMSFVTGVQNFITMISDASTMEESNWKRVGQTFGKTYLGFALRPLPWNSAIVQQTWKFFDPASYSQKDIRSILAYSAGLQHFRTLEINFPSIDQLGDEVKTYPGEALMPYTFWFDVKGQDPRWRFLADNNAIPTKVQNGLTYIETEEGVEKRTMEVKELYLYSKEVGNIFSKNLSEYMADSKRVEKRKNDRITTEDIKLQTETKTGIQEDIEKMWSDARADAKVRIFSWYDFKKDNEADWKTMVEAGALRPPITELPEIEVNREKITLTREQLVEFNQFLLEEYHKKIIGYLNNKELVDAQKKQPSKKTIYTSKFDEKTTEEWNKATAKAKLSVERQLKAELTKGETQN